MIGGALAALAALRGGWSWVRANWRLALALAGAVAVLVWRRALQRDARDAGRREERDRGAIASAEISEGMRDANAKARDAGGGDVGEWLRGDDKF
jgi:hypothetical protein